MSEGKLVVEKRGAVGWVVFDNTARRNALNLAMWKGIPLAMEGFDKDPDIRCIVFRGAGTDAFAAGADISEFAKVRATTEAIAQYDVVLDLVFHAIQDSRKPSVAMIHGFCMGGGLEVALACDLRYAGESGQFAIPAAKLGLAYSPEGHKRLLETVGHARAREVMYLGRRYSAAEAYEMGMVERVLPDAELEAYVAEVAKTMSQNAPLAMANSKTIIEEYVKSSGMPDHAAMNSAIERCAKSEDYAEGRKAFMEKRKPQFRGR
jgi:enoyl-CoA hydratase/carnithine racemase